MLLFSDFPLNFSFGFQDPASDWLIAIVDLHDNIVFYLILICIFVLWFFFSSFFNPDHLFNLHHGNTIELLWTFLPTLILWFIGLPSLHLLYMIDEILDAEITVKAIGSQWYWSYSYSDYLDKDIDFDSFLIPSSDLDFGDLRQLAVDNYLVLPINTSIRLLITAADVLHSFAVPSLGIKADAVVGRLNTVGFIINRQGTFFGQCSELCGALHGFMPIGIHAVSLNNYLSFLNSF